MDIKAISDIIILRSLDSNDYTFSLDSPNIMLSTKIVIYNSGSKWKIVPLNIFLCFPIIYDFVDDSDGKYQITVIICPLTLRATMLKGKFTFEMYDDLTMLVRETTTGSIMPIDVGYKVDKEFVVHTNRRSEVKIMTLRDAVMIAPDALFINLTNKLPPYVINQNYYEDTNNIQGENIESLVHPKTLAYLIQYKSRKTGTEKYTIVLGKDAVANTVTGYNLKNSGYTEYTYSQRDKIATHEGYTMPILWFISKELYPNAKVVYIQ